MSSHRYEWVSRLADGDGTPEELAAWARQLSADPAARHFWHQIHWMRDRLLTSAGDPVAGLAPPSLADRVAVALEREPTLLIPRARRRAIDWPRLTAGLAVAASVAVLSLLLLPRVEEPAGHLPAVTIAQQPVVREYRRDPALDAFLVVDGAGQRQAQLSTSPASDDGSWMRIQLPIAESLPHESLHR
jgi:negative regulator of sigma E activity